MSALPPHPARLRRGFLPARPGERCALGRAARFGLSGSGLLWPWIALAQGIPLFGNESLVNEFCQGAGYNCQVRNDTFFAEVLGTVAFAILSFTGLVFTALILYGGYRWMLARGNEQEVERGKAIIRSAIIGLIVTIASYSIWLAIANFIL